MTAPTTSSFPDITRPDSSMVMVSEWTVETPEQQVAAIDAALDAWDGRPWPNGLLSHNCYLGADGRTVMHYSQWTSEEAIDDFYRTDPSERVESFLRAVPEIDRQWVERYRVYRSRRLAEPEDGNTVPIVVNPRYETAGEDHARRWVEAMLATAAAAHEAEPIEGLLASHYHISVDGTRGMLLAEWTSEEANRVFRETRAVGSDVIQAHGVRPLGGQVFRFYQGRSHI